MTYIKDEDSSRLPAWLCVEDARKRNAENISTYNEAEKSLGSELEARARSAYIRSRVYLNYREKFIAVKVERPSAGDRISPAVKELESFAELHNIKIVRTAANTVYRINKV